MNTSSENISDKAAKKVAMRLQTLSAPDRSWLLTRLNSGQRQQVIRAEQALLEITRSANVNFNTLLEDPTSESNTAPKPAVFSRWPTKRVSQLLDALPPLWVAGIFHFTSWRGAGRYLMDQSPDRRKAIQTGHLPLRSSACLALCRVLEQALEEA